MSQEEDKTVVASLAFTPMDIKSLRGTATDIKTAAEEILFILEKDPSKGLIDVYQALLRHVTEFNSRLMYCCADEESH